MARIFEGLAGVVNKTFGAPLVLDPDGAALAVVGLIRQEAVQIESEHGGVVEMLATTLRLMAPDAETVVRGTLVEQKGQRWAVDYSVPSESPAEMRFVRFVLMEVDE